MKHYTFVLSSFLCTLYTLADGRFTNRPEWFRSLFYSYHVDCDKCHDTQYQFRQNALSEVLTGKLPFPRRMYQFYFSYKNCEEELYEDIERYLFKVAFTEGRRQHYLEVLVPLIESSNIYTSDKEYILSSPNTNGTLEHLVEICYRTICALI